MIEKIDKNILQKLELVNIGVNDKLTRETKYRTRDITDSRVIVNNLK